jgi:hypothetical protein
MAKDAKAATLRALRLVRESVAGADEAMRSGDCMTALRNFEDATAYHAMAHAFAAQTGQAAVEEINRHPVITSVERLRRSFTRCVREQPTALSGRRRYR